MNTKQQDIYYAQIAKAIGYIDNHRREQATLDAVAAEVGMSPFHFQRIFKEWAGISPKQFLQHLNANYAKRMIAETRASLFDTAHEVGLSGTSRLHDLFISIEGMTPGEYRNGGRNLTINYSYAASPFGDILIASTPKGICSMEFADNHDSALHSLKCKFPNARHVQLCDAIPQSFPSTVRIFPSASYSSSQTFRLRSHDFPPEGTLSWWKRYVFPLYSTMQ